jgi:hypothetical protein
MDDAGGELSKAAARGGPFERARDLSLGGLTGALGVLLPVAFHAIGGPAAGKALLPMHIPVLMAGLLCSPSVAASVGLLVPLVSWALTQMPPMVPPMAILMSAELAALGLAASLIYRRGRTNLVLAVIGAMVAARIVYGAGLWVAFPLFVPAAKAIPFWAYFAGGLVSSIAGVAIQLVAVPLAIRGIERIRLLR